MEYFTIFEKIMLGCEIIIYSLLLSLIVLFVIKIKKDFNSAFYHLLLLIFIAHFIMWPAVALLGVKLWRFGLWRSWYINNGWVASTCYTLNAYLDNAIYIAQSLVAFNRSTALWFPMKQKKIWKRKWYLYICLLIPILFVCLRFNAEGFYKVNPDGTVQGGNVDKKLEAIGTTINALTLGINTGIAFTLNALIIYKLKKETQINMVPVEKSVELIIYSIILTFIQCVRFAYNRLAAFFIYNASVTFLILTTYPYINATHSIAASFGILILSQMTRQIYLDFYVYPILSKCLNIKKYFKSSKTLPM